MPVSNLDATPTVVRLLIPQAAPAHLGQGNRRLGQPLVRLRRDTRRARQQNGAGESAAGVAREAVELALLPPSNGRWSTSQSAAGALLDAAGGHVPHMLHPVVHDGEIVSLASSSVFDRTFRWATSATPWGVVTVGGSASRRRSPARMRERRDTDRLLRPPARRERSGREPVELLDVVLGAEARDLAGPLRAGLPAALRQPRPGRRAGRLPAAEPSETTRSFVTGAYTDMRRRSPGADEVDWWTNEIAVKGYCRSRLIAALARDTGYLNTVVDDAYELTLRRAPSEAVRAQRVGRILDGTEGRPRCTSRCSPAASS